MNNFNKTFLLLLVLLLSSLPAIVVGAQQNAPPTTFHLTGQVVYVNIESGFYGIIGDDGKKYQPTNLPRKLRTQGTPIKFDAQTKENMVSSIMWGNIVELSNASQITSDISNDERSAIFVLLKRMDAFNNKDLAKLQQIDNPSKQLTPEQFSSWIGSYSNYTLHYVNVDSADSSSITGICYYTRELINGMTMHGNIELAAMTFTISQTPSGWKLTDSGSLKDLPVNYETDPLADLKQKAITKYKTDNLLTFLQ